MYLFRTAKRIVILVIGLTVCLFGLAIGFLPGPGPIVLIPVGLAILATEFAWARYWLRKYKDASGTVWSEIKTRVWGGHQRNQASAESATPPTALPKSSGNQPQA